MTPAPLPANERERLAALKRYAILDTPPEADLDDLTWLAAQLCGTPISLISLVDANRQWFKSKVGLDVSETPRHLAFCAHAIHCQGIMEVPDALDDERFRGNPLVTGDPGIRFYAGFPLTMADCNTLGTLCVIDLVARQLSTTQREALARLGREVVRRIEMRRSRDEFQRQRASRVKAEFQLEQALKELDDVKVAVDRHSIVVITDATGRITFANEKFCATSKYSREELIGQDLRIVNSGYHSKAFMREFWATISQGRAWKGEFRNRAKDGSVYWVETTVAPFLEPDGRPYQYVAIQTDITSRKGTEQEKEGLLARLEEKHAEMERFLYTVSHDLKSPLITIKSFAGMVEKNLAGGRTERLGEDLGRICKAADQMSSLLEEVLRFSRLSAVANALESVALTEVAESARELVAGRLAERSIVVDIQPAMPVVFGDRGRLIEVMQNLLDNAAKFMGDQDAPRIEIGVAREGPMPRFFVRDNGIGVDKCYQTKIFNLFDKLDSKAEGTGVGLSVVKRIIENHGGKVWVESEGAGQGTTFWFTLPRPSETPARRP